MEDITKAIAWLDATDDYAWPVVKAKLDELDQEDFFGTEGWRHFFGVD